jgi:hypothetical protein
VKKKQKHIGEEPSSLRERIRDQKYPSGFMKPAFPEMSEAGLAHAKHLEKPIPIYTGAASAEHWSRIKGTRCVVRAMDFTQVAESAAQEEIEESNKKAKQGF